MIAGLSADDLRKLETARHACIDALT